MSSAAWEEVKGGKKKPVKGAPKAPQEEVGANKTIYGQYEEIVARKEAKKAEMANGGGSASSANGNVDRKAPDNKGQAKGGKSAAATTTTTTKPVALEEKVKTIEADRLRAVWEDAKTRFPKNAAEWVKALGDELIVRLGEAHPDDPDESPLCFVDKEVKATVLQLLTGETTLGTIPDLLAESILHSMALSRERKKPSAGLNLFIQLMLVVDASIKQAHIVARAALALKPKLKDSLKNLSLEEAGPLMRVLRQVSRYAPHTFLLVWKYILLPVVVGESSAAVKDLVVQSLTPFCARSSQALQQQVSALVNGLKIGSPLAFSVQNVHGGLMNPKEFGAFLMAAFGNAPYCSEEQRQILRAATPVIREVVLRHPIGLQCLPVMLGLAGRVPQQDRLHKEVVYFIVKTLLLHPGGYEVVLARYQQAQAEEQEEEMKEEDDKKDDKKGGKKDKSEKEKQEKQKSNEQSKQSRLRAAVAEAAVVVQGLSAALAEGWQCNNVDALKAFLKNTERETSALFKTGEIKVLGEGVTVAENLIKSCKTLLAEMDPPDDGAWLLWMALVMALGVFVVLLAHLACRQVTSLALPENVCGTLNDLGFLHGVDRFYELAAPLVPHVEHALAQAQPYAETVVDFCRPYAHMLADLAGRAAEVAEPYVQQAIDYVRSLRKP